VNVPAACRAVWKRLEIVFKNVRGESDRNSVSLKPVAAMLQLGPHGSQYDACEAFNKIIELLAKDNREIKDTMSWHNITDGQCEKCGSQQEIGNAVPACVLELSMVDTARTTLVDVFKANEYGMEVSVEDFS